MDNNETPVNTIDSLKTKLGQLDVSIGDLEDSLLKSKIEILDAIDDTKLTVDTDVLTLQKKEKHKKVWNRSKDIIIAALLFIPFTFQLGSYIQLSHLTHIESEKLKIAENTSLHPIPFNFNRPLLSNEYDKANKDNWVEELKEAIKEENGHEE